MWGNIILGQNTYYAGIEPRFGQESWYEEGEMDINVAPFVFEWAVANKLGVRARSSVFLHSGGEESGKISLTGGGLGFFYYFREKADEHQYGGLFIGPWNELNYDHLQNFRHYTLAMEAGYSFDLGKNWSLNASGQYGRSFFISDETTDDEHFGIYVNFGFWF